MTRFRIWTTDWAPPSQAENPEMWALARHTVVLALIFVAPQLTPFELNCSRKSRRVMAPGRQFLEER